MTERNFDEALHGLETGAGAAQDPGAPYGAEADASSHPAVAGMRARFADTVLHHTIAAGDEHVVYVAAERVREVLQWLHDDDAHRYDLLLDLTAVDYGGGRPLEVFYQLWSTTGKLQLRVKVTLPLTELEVDSVTGIWNAADWLERETWDMFGIHFRGHPDLRRILMPDNYAEGHPLRKDFPLRGRFTRAEQTRRALSMAVEDFYTPDELSLGRVPAAPGVTRETAGTTSAPDRAAAAATPPAAATPRAAAAYPGTGSVTEASGAPGPETI